MPPSMPWRPASEATIKSRSRSRRSAKRSRTPSHAEVEAPSGCGALERKPTRGTQDNTVTTASAKKGIALLTAKSHVPTTGPASCSAPASVPLSTPLACSSAFGRHQLGHDRLRCGVVHGSPAWR